MQARPFTSNDGSAGNEVDASEPVRVASYRFSADILQRAGECRNNDNYHGALELLEDWVVIVVCVYCGILAWDKGWALAIPIYIVGILLIGGRQRALADILHQAAHRTLTESVRLGNLLGTVFSGYLVLQSLSGYRTSHVRQHHAFLGDPNLDPDYRQYQLWKICGSNLNSAAVRRHLLRSLTPGSTFAYLLYLIRHRILPAGENASERVIVAVTGVICSFGYGRLLLLFWLIPLVTTHAWIGAFLELVEHYPMIESRHGVDIHMSRNRRCGWFSSFVLGLKQYDGYHIVHHKFPFIPSWRLPEVHNILMEDEVYRSVSWAYGWKVMLKTILSPERSDESVTEMEQTVGAVVK